MALSPSPLKKEKPKKITKENWRVVEYEQLHQYARELNGSSLRLAQLSFVINPVLGAAFAYVWLFLNKKPDAGSLIPNPQNRDSFEIPKSARL